AEVNSNSLARADIAQLTVLLDAFFVSADLVFSSSTYFAETAERQATDLAGAIEALRTGRLTKTDQDRAQRLLELVEEVAEAVATASRAGGP
ncbi:hypothetical protein, partial [Escherichia coli]|uniref:hypothetical protein n=1 Tax=Escherichia coli TaxID=562 RepID=UPI0014120280